MPNGDRQDESSIRVLLPEAARPGAAFQQSQVLSTNRGELGVIHLWTKQPTLSPNEMRLFQTIASQAALAVERALLSKAENRTENSGGERPPENRHPFFRLA